MSKAASSYASAVATAGADYLARGWNVLPLRAREKRPLIRWEALQHKRVSATDLAGWLRRWPDANIGIVTGELSGLIVLDVDPKHGGDASLTRLEQRFGVLPQTVEAVTGGGGRHCYFKHPGGLVRNRVGLAQGVDLRGDGGYIVAPPSIHPSGRPYVWRKGHAPGERVPAPPPHWLQHLAVGAQAGRRLAEWRALVHDGAAQGQRNATVASLSGHLFWHGVDPQVTLELLLAWNRQRCRPPLADAEVAGVVSNIARLHEADGLQHTEALERSSPVASRNAGNLR